MTLWLHSMKFGSDGNVWSPSIALQCIVFHSCFKINFYKLIISTPADIFQYSKIAICEEWTSSLKFVQNHCQNCSTTHQMWKCHEATFSSTRLLYACTWPPGTFWPTDDLLSYTLLTSISAVFIAQLRLLSNHYHRHHHYKLKHLDWVKLSVENICWQ